jgi:hypothetical protein
VPGDEDIMLRDSGGDRGHAEERFCWRLESNYADQASLSILFPNRFCEHGIRWARVREGSGDDAGDG